MDVENWPVDRLKPYGKNPRKNAPAVAAVADSILEFGFRQPIVVDPEGVIVAGHTRWLAAKQLKLCHVPVHVVDLTPEKLQAYRIADNKTGELATWDLELLAGELADLQTTGRDLATLGFTADELGKIMGGDVAEGLVGPDAVPEPPAKASTVRGDLYILGVHRLLCGDSSSAADVDRLLGGVSIHLVNTDPPYNVKVEATTGVKGSDGNTGRCGFRGKSKRGVPGGRRSKDTTLAKSRPIEGDWIADEDFESRLGLWFNNIARVLLPGRSFYIWAGYRNLKNYPSPLVAAGLFWHQALIWVKQWPFYARKDFMPNHEWCFYGWREGAAHVFFGPNNVADVWSVKKVAPQSMVHLTEKPVELAVRAIHYSSRKGENVLDLFGGSGSTLIAAEQTGRRAFLMEIDELYCDVIVKRWEQFTGQRAKKETNDGILDETTDRNRRMDRGAR